MQNSISGSLFKELLTMVYTHFKIRDSKQFVYFSKGVEYYTQYLFLHDIIVDNEIEIKEDNLNEDSTYFLSHHYHQKSILALSRVFLEDHPFWKFLESKERVYFNSLAKEKYYSNILKDVSINEFEELAISKHILSVVPIRGMFFLGSTNLTYEIVEELFKLIFCGIQMLDDLDDFNKDLKLGQWNYLQSEVRSVIFSEGLINDSSITDIENKVLYAAGIAEYAFDYSISKFNEAKDVSAQIGLEEINNWLNQMLLEVENQKQYVLSIL